MSKKYKKCKSLGLYLLILGIVGCIVFLLTVSGGDMKKEVTPPVAAIAIVLMALSIVGLILWIYGIIGERGAVRKQLLDNTPPQEVHFCPDCRINLPNHASFCPKCGRSIKVQSNSKT